MNRGAIEKLASLCVDACTLEVDALNDAAFELAAYWVEVAEAWSRCAFEHAQL